MTSMTLITIVLVLLSTVVALNITLTVGIVRRLREHSTQLTELRNPDAVMAGPETVTGEFSAETVDGQRLSERDWQGLTLVGFFSPTCTACHERLPVFIEHARRMPGGRPQVLAIVVGQEDTAEQVAQLTPVARTVVEAPDGPLAKAFSVKGFPAFAVVDDGRRILASGYDLDQVPLPVAA
jgi:hypothetical protein